MQTALTASATLLAFQCGAKQWSKLFPGSLHRRGTSVSLFTNSQRKRVHARFVASNVKGSNGGVAEISESEKTPGSYAWPDKKKPRVCILGGGFGGLYTALRLESLVWPDDNKPQVILVDQSEHFVFKPMLYELLSGEVDEWEIAPRFSDLLQNTSVQFFQDRVKLLHPSDHWGINVPTGISCGGTVHLESGLLIEYDWLVLALGAEAKLDVVPGAAEFALPFSTLEDARKVDQKLRIFERRTFGNDSLISVAVVGCGYAGVELAATVSERLQERGIVRAINVETVICPTAPPGNREAALKVLSSRKVELVLGYLVRCIRRVGDLESSEILTGGGEVQGSRFHDSVNARGQAETDETLRVKGHPRIFALGDSSALRDSNGRLLPATAQVAFQQADFAGWNLWAAINGRPLLPFRFQNLGEMMTLGRNDAALSPSFIEGLTLDGPVGHAARKIAYLIRLPTDEHRLKVGISWLTKSAIDSVAAVQSTLAKVLSG
ncbi:Alternative NAD(P)H-ubiquinone oxidoreductase C1, chloroplastic/mitochondrial [Quillaja saponaria]|uniref:Alternative NAD(P)H-ubiquinone oxidoreductase C1, chloroplastic/mitochondrial n=1 Tax=Quillaja saponaria TaxID=32244 RepID=A0AAD7KSV8_QUISA|nr:Alternative NAD(P)H-ubiquinone oxidoreductase C1, chloroplastic/mitochondrial [Quillaja saponaria]